MQGKTVCPTSPTLPEPSLLLWLIKHGRRPQVGWVGTAMEPCCWEWGADPSWISLGKTNQRTSLPLANWTDCALTCDCQVSDRPINPSLINEATEAWDGKGPVGIWTYGKDHVSQFPSLDVAGALSSGSLVPWTSCSSFPERCPPSLHGR